MCNLWHNFNLVEGGQYWVEVEEIKTWICHDNLQKSWYDFGKPFFSVFNQSQKKLLTGLTGDNYTSASRRGRGYTVLPLSVLPSVQDIFRCTFLTNCWWQKSDIWSQASYRYTILWVAFLDPSDSYFLFADLVGFYTHWTYMHIFRHIFLSNY